MLPITTLEEFKEIYLRNIRVPNNVLLPLSEWELLYLTPNVANFYFTDRVTMERVHLLKDGVKVYQEEEINGEWVKSDYFIQLGFSNDDAV